MTNNVVITSTPEVKDNLFSFIYKLKDFKVIKNKQLPDICYKYVKKVDDFKYTIFTLNGTLFHCSIERLRLNKRYYTVKRNEFLTIDECLEFLNEEIIKDEK